MTRHRQDASGVPQREARVRSESNSRNAGAPSPLAYSTCFEPHADLISMKSRAESGLRVGLRGDTGSPVKLALHASRARPLTASRGTVLPVGVAVVLSTRESLPSGARRVAEGRMLPPVRPKSNVVLFRRSHLCVAFVRCAWRAALCASARNVNATAIRVGCICQSLCAVSSPVSQPIEPHATKDLLPSGSRSFVIK